MALIDLQVKQFIDEVNSSSPAPGGGSVSALSGSLGVSLARMVGHLTIPKKAFKKLTDNDQERFISVFEEFEQIAQKLTELVDKDTEAFNQIMAAFKLPKETETDQINRSKAIEEATIGAIRVPLVVAELSYQALVLLPVIVEFGNKNCLSDLGVGALQLHVAIRGSLMNVKINLSGLSDASMIKMYEDRSATLLEESAILAELIVSNINKKL